MAELFTVQNLMTLLMLTLLQAVLGFDNLLYISMESKRVAREKQAWVRKVSVLIAIGLRIILLFVVLEAIEAFQTPLFDLDNSFVKGAVTGHSLIVLAGGGFILYTAVKEIFHMIALEDAAHMEDGKGERSVGSAITAIVVMNLVFSFDSILGAVALTKVFVVMATAIAISGALMLWLAESVSAFLQRNRMYEVLGLFILLLVGILLVSEGGHLAHLEFFGHPVEPMTKTTFYFVLAFLIVVDIVQSRYRRKLQAAQDRRAGS